MPAYESNLFDPPAPLARVSLRNPNSGKNVTNVRMLIDSGADLTLIPAILVDELECDIEAEEGYELEGFEGRKSLAKSVQLELKFLGRTFRGRFVVLNSECGILGRNVLNHMALLLDGPHLSWSEQKDSSK